MEIGDDAEFDAVVAAALALIDEAYPTLNAPTTRSRRTRQELLWLLREQVAELERELAQRQFGSLDGSSRSALWAQVADSQRQQWQQAVKENAVLRDHVKTQRAIAIELKNVLEKWSAPANCTNTLRDEPSQIDTPTTSPQLTNRLNELANQASRKWLGLLPSIGPEYRERGAECSPEGDVLVFQSRYASYMPFKLSLVASELWALMLCDAFGCEKWTKNEEEVLANKVSGDVVRRLSLSPLTQLEACGSSAFRRSLTPDGTVVLASVSSAAGSVVSVGQGSIGREGYEMQEAEWLRIGRVPSSSSSLVYIESVTCIKIKPVYPSCQAKLQCVGDALARECERIGKSTVQRLENRLLDAPVSRRH